MIDLQRLHFVEGGNCYYLALHGAVSKAVPVMASISVYNNRSYYNNLIVVSPISTPTSLELQGQKLQHDVLSL